MQVGESNLNDILLHCCVDDISDIRQSAHALLGDLARVCWKNTKSHIHLMLCVPLLNIHVFGCDNFVIFSRCVLYICVPACLSSLMLQPNNWYWAFLFPYNFTLYCSSFF